MEQWWVEAAREALEKFEPQMIDGSTFSWQRMVAFADTGSRYEVATMPYAEGQQLVAIVQPWQRVYPKFPKQMLHPEYFAEKWGKPGCRLDQMHGGDVYALMKCMSVLIDVPIPDPEELL